MSNKVVRVTYTVDDVFIIPNNIDLNNKELVDDYWVKYNTLHILLTNGKIIEIDSQGYIDNNDYKYPQDTEVIYADDVCIDEDDEGFKAVNLEVEEKKE